MLSDHDDWLIRQAVFRFVENESTANGGVIPWGSLANKFHFRARHICLVGMRGIWTPKEIDLPISIRTSLESEYEDAAGEDGLLRYKYFQTDPYHRDNVGLRSLMRRGAPILYLQQVSKGWYTPLWPLVVVDDNPATLTFTLACEDVESLVPGIAPDIADEARRRYVTKLAIARLHQTGFRKRVLSAYRDRCTICRLNHPELLDAAHIIPDREERGDPVIPNGLSLCKIHHAAYDANILGIRPDYRVEIRANILEERDGPMLKHGIQELHGLRLTLPLKMADKPDPDRLNERFQKFLAVS